jgi:hypothetical protein
MIGAQAYYRNCGFVHFIEEVKSTTKRRNKMGFYLMSKGKVGPVFAVAIDLATLLVISALVAYF